MFLAVADSELSRCDGGERLAQAVVERDRLAFPHFETKPLRLLPFPVFYEPHLDGKGRQGPRDGDAVQTVHIARQVIAQFQHVLFQSSLP